MVSSRIKKFSQAQLRLPDKPIDVAAGMVVEKEWGTQHFYGHGHAQFESRDHKHQCGSSLKYPREMEGAVVPF